MVSENRNIRYNLLQDGVVDQTGDDGLGDGSQDARKYESDLMCIFTQVYRNVRSYIPR